MDYFSRDKRGPYIRNWVWLTWVQFYDLTRANSRKRNIFLLNLGTKQKVLWLRPYLEE